MASSSLANAPHTQPQLASTLAASTTSINGGSSSVQSLLVSKKRILQRYFDELSQNYISAHNRNFQETESFSESAGSAGSSGFGSSGNGESGGCAPAANRCSSSVLDEICKTVSHITGCSEIKCLTSINYNKDSYSSSSLVRSIDFDRSYEHFAMAGVTKRIKIFNFAKIVDKPHVAHNPLSEMQHTAMVSISIPIPIPLLS